MADAPIPPALTSDEWARRRHEPLSQPGFAVQDDGDGLEFVTEVGTPDFQKWKIDRWDRDGISAVMALANAALPDGDPRKLTRADVDFRGVAMCFDALWELVGWAAASGRHNDVDAVDITEARERLDRLAAKLAALLPPV